MQTAAGNRATDDRRPFAYCVMLLVFGRAPGALLLANRSTEVESAPGKGTRVRGVLPAPVLESSGIA